MACAVSQAKMGLQVQLDQTVLLDHLATKAPLRMVMSFLVRRVTQVIQDHGDHQGIKVCLFFLFNLFIFFTKINKLEFTIRKSTSN